MVNRQLTTDVALDLLPTCFQGLGSRVLGWGFMGFRALNRRSREIMGCVGISRISGFGYTKTSKSKP